MANQFPFTGLPKNEKRTHEDCVRVMDDCKALRNYLYTNAVDKPPVLANIKDLLDNYIGFCQMKARGSLPLFPPLTL